jgi:hypothetical protein
VMFALTEALMGAARLQLQAHPFEQECRFGLRSSHVQ